jgi:hypothetical protein
VLSDLVHGEVIGLAKDRSEDSLVNLLTTCLDARQRAAVKAVCTDMHRPYINAVAGELAKAEIVFDKFHVEARQNAAELNFAPTPATIHRMLELLIVAVRSLALALRGHRELVLENLALRQQLAAFHRTTRCLRQTRYGSTNRPSSSFGERHNVVARRTIFVRTRCASAWRVSQLPEYWRGTTPRFCHHRVTTELPVRGSARGKTKRRSAIEGLAAFFHLGLIRFGGHLSCEGYDVM